MGFITVKEHQLFFKEREGNGPGLLLLPSSGLGANQWDGLARIIRTRLSYSLSYLQYRPSDLWKGDGLPDITIDFLGAEKLLDLLIKKGGGPIDLAGHSYGGFLALSLAKKYPEKIRKMAIFEPIAWGVLRGNSQKEELKQEFEDLCQQLFCGKLVKEEWLRLFLDFWNVPGFWDTLNQAKKSYWINLFPKIYAEVSALCLDKKNLSYWADLKQPIRIFQSELGPKAQREVCQLLFSVLEKGDLVETTGGHMAPITHGHDIFPLFANWF